MDLASVINLDEPPTKLDKEVSTKQVVGSKQPTLDLSMSLTDLLDVLTKTQDLTNKTLADLPKLLIDVNLPTSFLLSESDNSLIIHSTPLNKKPLLDILVDAEADFQFNKNDIKVLSISSALLKQLSNCAKRMEHIEVEQHSNTALETDTALFPVEVTKLSDAMVANKMQIKLGVARIGSWHHPVYKTVKFDYQDFQDIIENFSNNVLGFEPGLYLGHATETISSKPGLTYSTVDGAPAEGFLNSLSIEGDILYSVWDVNNPTTYEAVKSGAYRYNSCEVIRNFMSKSNGKNLGTVLYGMALTNRPFVPNLPPVVALSQSSDQDNIQSVSFELQSTEPAIEDHTLPVNNMTKPEQQKEAAESTQPAEKPAEQQPEQPAEKPATDAQLATSVPSSPTPESFSSQASEFAQRLSAMGADYEQRLSATKSDYEQKLSQSEQRLQEATATFEQQLSQSNSQIQELSTKLASVESQLKQERIDTKVKSIESLSLPTEVKAQYIDLVKKDALGSSEESILKALQQTAQVFGANYTQQQGLSMGTSEVDNPQAKNPYADIIAKNRAAAKSN